MKKQTKSKNEINKSKASNRRVITKSMTFAQLIDTDKDAAMKLAEKGMFCCGCPMALTETIEDGARAHGIDTDKLVEEISSKFKTKKSSGVSK